MYQIPPEPVDPKYRYVRVTDTAEIAACIRNEIGDPDGELQLSGEWFATLDSLRKFRGEPAEIEV